MTMNFQRHAPISASMDRFIRPSHFEAGHLHGWVWVPELAREVEVRAFVPKNWDPDGVLEGASAGRLVLDRSLSRLTRAQL